MSAYEVGILIMNALGTYREIHYPLSKEEKEMLRNPKLRLGGVMFIGLAVMLIMTGYDGGDE